MKDKPIFFKTPFSPSYWRQSILEFKSLRTIVLAALFIALRLVLKQFKIPVADSLSINVVFLANTLGAMIVGPVIAFMSGTITDILGYILKPSGPFFPGFVLVEALGSFIYALFLYRTRITIVKLFFAKFSVSFICNLILTPIFLNMMYGKGIIYYLIPRITKNLILLPFETALLVILFGSLLPVLSRIKAVPIAEEKLKWI